MDIKVHERTDALYLKFGAADESMNEQADQMVQIRLNEVPEASNLRGELEFQISNTNTFDIILESKMPLLKSLEGFRIQLSVYGEKAAIRESLK